VESGDTITGGVSRRDFLHRFGVAGGSALVMSALNAWDLSGAPAGPRPAWTGRADARVLVLGAGVSGLAVCHELVKLGYDARILEARDRVGGVNQSVRRGTRETDLDGQTQVCRFDEGQYLNAGPWRIRNGDEGVLGYCRELGVPLEIFVNENDDSFLYYEGEEFGEFSGKRLRLREVKADMRGHTAELLAKAVSQEALDLPLTTEDREQLVSYLAGEGYLDREDFAYRGGNHRGGGEPHAMASLLAAGFASRVRAVDGSGTRPPVFQPVGGMDQLPKAFARALAGRITMGAEVRQIRQTGDGVRAIIADTATGAESEVTADYVVSCIPLTILRDIDVNLSSGMMETVANTGYSGSAKIGLQTRRRFWEEDDGIYGGPTYSNLPVGQFAFPSNGYGQEKGVILGFYGNGGIAGLVDLTNEERIEHVLSHAGRAHPQLHEEFETGYCAFWEKTRYSKGAFAGGGGGTDRVERLRTPDNRIFIGCAAASSSPGWMEGAVSAAWAAVDSLHQRVMQG
jgi:monoamine oxidase